MPRGNWKTWAIDLRERMLREKLTELTLSIDEIVDGTGTTMSPESVRSVGFWNACRDGRPDFGTIPNQGLSIEFKPSSSGEVLEVKFRLDARVG